MCTCGGIFRDELKTVVLDCMMAIRGDLDASCSSMSKAEYDLAESICHCAASGACLYPITSIIKEIKR